MERPLPRGRAPALVAALLLLLWAAGAWAAPFSFVAIGDTQGRTDAEPVNAVFSRIVAKVLELEPRPAFVLVAGDLVVGEAVPGEGREATLTRELRAWQRAAAPLLAAGIRVYPVTGNHEVWGSYAIERERACRKVLGELQYSFSYQGSRFIGLDTDRVGQRRTPDLAWLEGQLASARAEGAEHVFVFGHEPAFTAIGRDSLKDADAFWKLLADYGADAYICGHEHLYGRTTRAGVLQVTTGGAGGPLLPIAGAAGFDVAVGTYHLTVWRVDGPRVEIRSLSYDPTKGSIADAWRQIDALTYTKPRPFKPAAVPAKAAGKPTGK